MSSVYEVRWRVLRERVEAILIRAEHAHGDEEFVRLAALGLALLDRHKVDDKGRCRCCRSYRGWRQRSRQCTVFPMLSFYLCQPRRLFNILAR